MSTLTALVTGATGKQGGAVARALVARGHTVRGMTRNPESDKAKALAAAGIEPIKGDFAHPDSLRTAAQGVDAVFAMSTPFESGEAAEVAQGKAIVDAVKAANVPHLVYTSVGGADLATGIPHFDSKYEVEKYLATADVPYTVIAPVYFMDNLFFPQSLQALQNGVYSTPLPADTKLQQIATEDIGAFAAHVLEHRDAHLGQRIDITSDELTGAEQAALLAERLGKEIRYEQTPMAAIRSFSEDMALMYEWFIAHGYKTDVAALHAKYPDVGWHSMRSWLAKQTL